MINPEIIFLIQEALKNQLSCSIDAKKKLDKDINQLSVENQWLANSKKKSSGVNEKMEDMGIEIQELKRELREEKEKVEHS